MTDRKKNKSKKEDELTWQDIGIGAIVTEPANARSYRTGDWRTKRPEVNKDECIKCGMCFLFCPEGCIRCNEEGYFLADPFYCKGCGICSSECPKKCINMVEEAEE